MKGKKPIVLYQYNKIVLFNIETKSMTVLQSRIKAFLETT